MGHLAGYMDMQGNACCAFVFAWLLHGLSKDGGAVYAACRGQTDAGGCKCVSQLHTVLVVPWILICRLPAPIKRVPGIAAPPGLAIAGAGAAGAAISTRPDKPPCFIGWGGARAAATRHRGAGARAAATSPGSSAGSTRRRGCECSKRNTAGEQMLCVLLALIFASLLWDGWWWMVSPHPQNRRAPISYP
eukprot:498230-Pelagomonas_calceolata.AAC.2